MARKQTPEEFWYEKLTKHQPVMKLAPRVFHALPSDPRCKLCYTPFAGPGGVLMRRLGRPQSRANPTLCDPCEHYIEEYPGGTEVELSMLFADVRGSTTLAEHMSPTAFREMLSTFYARASDVLVNSNAMVSNLVGDQISGYYFPAAAGEQHARVAVKAGMNFLKVAYLPEAASQQLPVGIGVHTGLAFCGSVEGAAGLRDFVVLGDAVNITSRLSSVAGAGELLISAAAAKAAGLETTGMEMRELELRGRSEPVRVWVYHLETEAKESAQFSGSSERF